MIELSDVCYRYAQNNISVLEDVSFSVQKGDVIAILGKSGCGKTTLLNLLGTLTKPSSGRYFFNGADIGNADDNDLAKIRNQSIGFVFQNFQLLPQLSAIENVMLPLVYSDVSTQESRTRAEEVLKLVDLSHRGHHKPMQLSGGQQQRVAIARAIVNRPSIMLADEPTGALDTQARNDIVSLLLQLNTQFNMTLVVVTHDEEVAGHCHRALSMKDGRLTH